MASISTTEAELGKSWESWLEKKDKYSGMTAKQRKIQESIDNEQREDPMVYDSKNAAWEKFLEKGIKYKDPDPKEIDPEKIMANAGDPITEITLTPDMKKKKSWEEWVEKQQGAGDARFGNQHLTGLDQKPVNNEEDEANIMPEKDEKTDDKEEKPNEKEEKYEEDNKPYKALDVK